MPDWTRRKLRKRLSSSVQAAIDPNRSANLLDADGSTGSVVEVDADPPRQSLFADPAMLWVIGIFACTVYAASTVTIGFVKASEIPNDYLSFWSAGELALNDQADGVYNRETHHQQSEAITGDRPLDNLPFLLPPTFLFVSIAVASIGFLPGMALLTIVGVTASAWPVWRLTRKWLGMVLALSAPTVLVNAQIGQLGMVFAGAATTALLDHQRHPWRSGIALAVLSLKPQLGAGIGVALVVSRAWRALSAGVFCSLVVLVMSILAFGPGRWIEFIGSLSQTDELVDKAGWANQGVYALLTSQGLSVVLAGAVHLLLVVAVGYSVLANVRRDGLSEVTMAMVLCMSILISPRSYVYDYQVLVPAAILMYVNRDELGRSEETVRWAILGVVTLGFVALLGYPAMPVAAVTLLWLSDAFAGRPLSRSSPYTVDSRRPLREQRSASVVDRLDHDPRAGARFLGDRP